MYFRDFNDPYCPESHFTIYQRTPYSVIIFQYCDDDPIHFETLDDLLDLFYLISFYDWVDLVLDSDFPDYIKNNFP